MKKKQADQLLLKYAGGKCTSEEEALIEAGLVNDFRKGYKEIGAEEAELAEGRIYEAIRTYANAHPKTKYIRLWPRIAAAASVAAIIVFSAVWFLKEKTEKHAASAMWSADVAPGHQGATLTLAGGKKIKLADTGNGKVAIEAGVIISKTATGQLVYQIKEQAANSSPATNTLSTANGETYQVRLPDGTAVWLNAASSLTYPVTFSASPERRVSLEGEAYFEIAPDALHPFIVQSGNQKTEVLGTSFNINSYKNEPATVTTLLSGMVKVSSGQDKYYLQPGEQAINTGRRITLTNTDPEAVIDWKKGDFNLNRINFREAMRKIARWYNVEVIYDSSVPDNIRSGGWISRNNKLSVVLESIELSGIVHFKIEGKTIYVTK